MKLSHPAAIKFSALLLSAMVKTWFSTISAKMVFDDRLAEANVDEPQKLYLFWHEMMLLPAHLFARTRISVLISEHRDGELIAQIIRLMGGHTTRGSTRKNGMTAVRRMMRRSSVSHLAITPDGPRGPRRQVAIGSIFLASRGHMQIVPCGFAFGNNWRVKSWDRMAFPIPGENAQGVVGKPIFIPPDLDREGMETYRLTVQQAMDDCQRRAEEMVCRVSGTDRAKVAALEPLVRRSKLKV